MAQDYWQQQTDFVIDVRLSSDEKTLDGNLQLTYTNNSPDTLHYIYFHLWPNAFKNDRTAFSKQLLKHNNTGFYFSNDEKRGYINKLNFTADGKTLRWETDSLHIDIARVYLSEPLLPNAQTLIATPFHVKLPYNFSRGGYNKGGFQVTQWYPKPAVYDKEGWHPMPYLQLGEYYNDFGNYEVTIHAPQQYQVAATGRAILHTHNASEQTTVYKQNNVTDFAWFAATGMIAERDSVVIDGKQIQMNLLYSEANKENWANAFTFLKRSLEHKTKLIGPYPYEVVSVVENNGDAVGGGMEYPTITLIDKVPTEKVLDMLINHEVGHNWFQASVSTNERKYPWMDEGMNSYYDNRYAEEFNPGNLLFDEKTAPKWIINKLPYDVQPLLLRTLETARATQPINTPSENLSVYNYGLIPYTKTAEWLEHIEKRIGRQRFNEMMQAYVALWQNKHPQPAEFKDILRQYGGGFADSAFAQLASREPLVKPAAKNLKVTGLFNVKDFDHAHTLSIFPAVAYNTYDKLMPGLLVHNYSLPMPGFRFVAVPLYSPATKSLNGMGRVGYKKFFSRNASLEVFTNLSHFTKENFTDSVGVKHHFNFSKIAPGIRYVFPQNLSTPSGRHSLSYKLFRVNEEEWLFALDPATNKTELRFPQNKYTIQQVAWRYENYRKLYPHSISIQTEIHKDFVRPTLTGTYFFNYAKGGGLQARLFAGKFIYYTTPTINKRFQTDRFHLSMSAVNGYRDYTYESVFFGRNDFDGFGSHQRMEKDGNFKVNTDLFSNEVGVTDNWLIALNFTSGIPNSIYPFNKYVPLKLFADVGTSDVLFSKTNTSNRLVFDGGVQISLLKDLININLPLVYSTIYRDYYKNVYGRNNWKKRISFQINIQNLKAGKFLPLSNF